MTTTCASDPTSSVPVPTERPAVGAPLRLRWRKWDGRPHWVHDCVYLGADAWGDWLGQAPGARASRPGREIVVSAPCLMLLPRTERSWVLTRNAAPEDVRIYIDLAWDVAWRDGEPTAIDMDLDVVERRGDGGLYIDDVDEWDEHRVLFGYPHDVQAEIERRAATLEDEVRRRVAPFDEATARHWFAVLKANAASPTGRATASPSSATPS